jgi:hypothetical protein
MKGMAIFSWIKERAEKRYQQKADVLIKEMAFEIKEFSDKKPEYFNVNNSIQNDVQLFEEKIWAVREVFNKNKDKIEKICKKLPQARKKFAEAETKFIRLERLLYLLKKEKHNFSEEQMAELEELEVNFYGKERLEKIKIMYNNYKAIELDKERIRIEKERNEVKEQGIRYIREMYPAMETNRRWTEEIQSDIAIAEFMNLQRNSFQGNKSASSSKRSAQTTEGRRAGATGRRNLRQKGGEERGH